MLAAAAAADAEEDESGSFPCEVVRSASTLLFSRPAQRLLTLQPVHSPNRLTILSIEGFRRLVALPPAPIATGWSDPCREGFAPSQELCLSTAHDFITTTLAFRFSVHTGDGVPIKCLMNCSKPAVFLHIDGPS